MTAPRSLSQAIAGTRAAGRTAVVADIKPVSPRDGALLGERSPAALAQELTGAGACALSVVTEEQHFGGSCDTLRQVADATPLPVLRKDFIRNRAQVAASRDFGASAVLLIMATTPYDVLRDLHAHTRALGMEPVVEVHTPEELTRALWLEPSVVGINNRDITQLETDPGDVSTTEHLAPMVPGGITVLAESAMLTAVDVSRALAAGAHAVLIGTMLLQASDPVSLLHALVQLEACP